MINLFLIVHNFSGVTTYVEELTEYFKNVQNVVLYHVNLNCENIKELEIQGENRKKIIRIPKKIGEEYNTKYYKRAALLIYWHFPNLSNVLIHANMPEQYYFIIELKKLYKCQSLFTFHFLIGHYTYYDKLARYNMHNLQNGNILEKQMLESADHIICVTKFAQRVVRNIYKVSAKKISVIYNGRSLINITKGPNNQRLLKVQYGFSARDRILLYAGQLESRKGIDNLIRAFLLIQNRFKSSKLVIAGTGDYDKYFPIAQDCIGRIIFTGRLNKQRMSDFYSFSEVGIVPSRYEQCSYVAIEMMHAHLPIIVSDVPGLRELVIHRKTGLICKTIQNISDDFSFEIDEVELSKHLEYFLSHENQRNKIANCAFNVAFQKHSLHNMGSMTERIYSMIANS